MILATTITEPTAVRFTSDDVYLMVEAGILAPDARVELIEGELLSMPAIKFPHFIVVARLTTDISRQLSREYLVSCQNPIHLSAMSEPEPDLAVIPANFAGPTVPEPDQLLLVIEVSDTTLDFDRNRKLPLYARAGIPEAWLIDIASATIERHSHPIAGRYSQRLLAGRGEQLSSLTLPAISIAIDDLFQGL